MNLLGIVNNLFDETLYRRFAFVGKMLKSIAKPSKSNQIKPQIGWIQVNKMECKVIDKIRVEEFELFEILSYIGVHTHNRHILRSNKQIHSFGLSDFSAIY